MKVESSRLITLDRGRGLGRRSALIVGCSDVLHSWRLFNNGTVTVLLVRPARCPPESINLAIICKKVSRR